MRQALFKRGVGLGNWLLPEGYMWKFEPPGPQSPREIEALVASDLGEAEAAEFWVLFRDRFITEADIARIAELGFDHVRLPINWRVVITPDGLRKEDGFLLIDRLIEWCRGHGLRVVLDLHGAPGGQTGTNIDDSLGTPALFEDVANQRLTIDLWRMIAQRYRDEPVVAGYDLLNEPLPNEYQHRHANDLVRLYQELTTTIREVDQEHLIIYEGMHWGTNWSIFTEVWDPHSMLQFHKYWSPPDLPSIARFIEIGQRLGLPIYMGEGGENEPGWLQTCFQLYEDHDIAWNFWPWKKIDTLTSPYSITPPGDWPGTLDWWGLLDRLDLSKCEYREEVVHAILRRAPLRIPATGFTFRGEGISYRTQSAQPMPSFRSDDKVTIVGVPDFDFPPRANELRVALGPGDWVEYEFTNGKDVTVHVEADQPVQVAVKEGTVRVAGTAPHTLLAWLDITERQHHAESPHPGSGRAFGGLRP